MSGTPKDVGATAGTRSPAVEAKVGHWCRYICGPSSGFDQTVLGLAVYDGDGNLAYSRWCGLEKAERRGDWRPEWMRCVFNPPAAWAEMEKTLGRIGNAMSQLRWEVGLPTLDWSAYVWDSQYRAWVEDKAGSGSFGVGVVREHAEEETG